MSETLYQQPLTGEEMKKARIFFKAKKSFSLHNNHRRLLRLRRHKRIKGRIEERHWFQFLVEQD